MTILSPIIHKDEYTKTIEREIVQYLDDVLFAPLAGLRENATETDALVVAILAGKVWFDEGFKGTFSAEISKRIHELGGFSIPSYQLPIVVREALANAGARLSAYKVLLLGSLAAAESNISIMPEQFDEKPIKEVVSDLVAQFERSIGDHEAIPTEIMLQVEEMMGDRLTGAMQALALVGVSSLREEVAKADTFASLEDSIQVIRTGLLRRAGWAAEGTTAKATSSLRVQLAEAFGIEEYKWVTVHDSRVRHDHKALDGRIFRFDSPPIVDNATGRRGNPGDDYNCRCHARPIIQR